MSTSSSSPATFTGSSAFSASLAQQLSNAVTIASIPMNNLQTQLTTLQGQQTELGTISGDFTSLATALSTIDSSTGSSSYAATVGTPAVASASVSSGVMAGTYSLSVTSAGANTNTLSNDSGLLTVTDPTQANLSTSTSFTLLVGPSGNQTSYSITDSDGTLDGLANAINASGANVQASVVNVGSSSSPDYRLSVQSLDYAPDVVQLEDNGNNNANMLTQLGTGGSYVSYSVNGEPSVNSTSKSLTLSTGLTVNVLGTGTTSITVAQNGNSIASALSSFANAYNAATAELVTNRGQNGGALTGDSTIYSLTELMNNIANYTGTSGSVTTLSQLGLTFDQNGNLDFSSSTFDQTASTNMTDVLNFLGSVSSDTGFLGAANDILTGINDPTTGLLPQDTANLTSENTDLTNQIADDQTQITTLQQSLTAQMSAADASIATLEQQASYLQMMFQTENADAQLGY
jgi:flagellar hook-associated protein 2